MVNNIGCVALPWHFEFYILKCKIFLINFLDELGNFEQKKFYTSKCKIFLYFKATDSYLTFEFVLSFNMLKHQQQPVFPSGLPSKAPCVPKWSLQWVHTTLRIILIYDVLNLLKIYNHIKARIKQNYNFEKKSAIPCKLFWWYY